MKKIEIINRKYPWLKTLVVFIFCFGVVGALVGLSLRSSENIASTQTLAEDTSNGAVPVMIEGEVRDVFGINAIVEEKKEEIHQQEEQTRVANLEGKMLVALTFDDGPWGSTTEQILNTLKEKNVRATFFMMGMQVDANPELAKRAAAEGHEIENHTWDHKNLTTLGVAEVQDEVNRTTQKIKEVTGVDIKYVRPPYGIFNQETADAVEQRLVTWSVDPRDWENMDAEMTYGGVMAGVHDGAVILMHDMYQSTADALPGIIDELRIAGYEFVTVDELSHLRDWVPGE